MSLQKNLLAASILCACTTAASGSTSPNILLIIADDMGLDSSPCHSVGNNHVSMPNLQSLCEQGMVFDNAYSAPVCSPTRDGNRGAKGSIFNGGVNIPLVVQGPNVLTGRTDALVNTTDIHATIASIAGIASDAPDAFDFTPALLGKATIRTQVYVEHFSDKPVRGRSPLGWSLRDAQYKLVALDDTAPMLFNLATDPFEKHDLLAAQPNNAERAKATELLLAHQKLTQ